MKDYIVGVMEFVLSVMLLLIVAFIALIGYMGGLEWEQIAYAADIDIDPDFDFRIFGAVVGAGIGFVIGSVLLGIPFLLLDIRQKLVDHSSLLTSISAKSA